MRRRALATINPPVNIPTSRLAIEEPLLWADFMALLRGQAKNKNRQTQQYEAGLAQGQKPDIRLHHLGKLLGQDYADVYAQNKAAADAVFRPSRHRTSPLSE